LRQSSYIYKRKKSIRSTGQHEPVKTGGTEGKGPLTDSELTNQVPLWSDRAPHWPMGGSFERSDPRRLWYFL